MFNGKKKEIYLDYAAVTPISPEVSKEMSPWLDGTHFGNPSSIHTRGRYARSVLDECISSIKNLLEAPKNSHVIFTSGGTESNTHALQAIKNGDTVLTTKIEHSSVRELLLNKEGVEVLYIPLTTTGKVDFDVLEAILSENKVDFASIMMVNNETGHVLPIKKITKVLRENNSDIIIHTDASQAPLYLSLDVKSLGVNLLTLCGQKIYGPQGSGILWISKDLRVDPVFGGGKQQERHRAGTEPMHQIVGITKALEFAHANRENYSEKMFSLQSFFLACNISFTESWSTSERLVSLLNVNDIYVSSKSACMGSVQGDSHVLDGLGIKAENAVRFSFGSGTTKDDIEPNYPGNFIVSWDILFPD